jgi:alpha-ribazole phosphatase
MKIVLVRHPLPAIRPGVCYGRLDVPLAAIGDVAPIVAELNSIGLARVWTSPARRCRVVADATGLAVRLDARLLELDFGAWEGMRWDAVPRAELDRWVADPRGFAAPGGETGAHLLARVSDVHAAILAAGEDCAVISHGGPLRLLDALLRGEPPDLLAPAPPFGSVRVHVAASDPSTTHSASTDAAPSTSPV